MCVETMRFGVESNVVEIKPENATLLANVRLIDSQGLELVEPASLNLVAACRLYDLAATVKAGRVPSTHLFEGPNERIQVSQSWSEILLAIPPAPPGSYAAVAKVWSSEDSEKLQLNPIRCYADELIVIERKSIRIALQDLIDIYAGLLSPIVFEEFRKLVKKGNVVAYVDNNEIQVEEDENGRLRFSGVVD
jgi:hypothetical protein